MKTLLSLGLIVAVSGTLACSEEGGADRNAGGTAGSTANAGTGGSGTAGSGTGGSGTAGSGTAGSGGTTRNYGPALVIRAGGEVEDVNGTTGIHGAALVVASAQNPSAVADFRDGALCMRGATAIVPGMDYTNYWGAQINVDLNRVANPAAGDAGAAPGDAGADAGDAGGGEVLGQTAGPWDPRPGNVIGFSFKIDGPTVSPVLSISAAPTGRDSSADPFCYRGISPLAGQTYDFLFTDTRLACWDSPPIEASVFQAPEGYTTLQNLGWQINADTSAAYMFDFCLSEIRPILGE